MNQVDTLGMRVVGKPFHFPPLPSKPVPTFGGFPTKNRKGRPGSVLSIPGMIAWYRGKFLNAGEGNDIAVWPDASGHHFDATSDGSVGDQLTQTYNSARTSRVAVGDGAREGFARSPGTGFLPNPNAFTAFFVARVEFASPFMSFSEFSGDLTLRLSFDSGRHFLEDATYAGKGTPTVEAVSVGWHYVVFIENGTSTQVWIDGKLLTWNGPNPGNLGINPYHYHVGSGSYQIFGGYPRMLGTIADAALFNRPVNTRDRLILENYARAQYKLA